MNGRTQWLSAAAVCTLVVTACAGGDDSTEGSTIDVFGPYVGVDADLFDLVLDDFEEATGLDVAYTGSVDFVADLRQRTIGNQRPDIAMVPQPAVASELQEAGRLVPLDPATFQQVRESYDEAALDALPWNPRFAVPYRANTKSLVWYRPEVFDANGWSLPATLDDLEALVSEIAADGTMAPWCFSISAGTATGWPATDWVEDLVLRRGGADAYDLWAGGDLSWQSTLVREAFEEFDRLVLVDGRTVGGNRAILQTEVPRASVPLFADDPGCAMYKQASFAEDWFPSGTEIGADADVDFFVLPGAEDGDRPLVVGGDAAVAFGDDPDVAALMTFLASADGGRSWAAEGGFVSERLDVDIDAYFDETDTRFSRLLRSDVTARFDASDMLPVAIGTELLWDLMTGWIAGIVPLDELLVTMDLQLGITAEPTG